MKKLLLLVLVATSTSLLAQPNCEYFKYIGDSLKYEACKKAEGKNQYYQFNKGFQDILDEALAIDSTFAYAYREKSVAYLKSGDFINWKQLMDKAVAYDPKENLGYRGWCRYQFFRDYRGAIQDIETLDSLAGYDIGYSANGDYHLQITRAICYKALDDNEKAIQIIEAHMATEGYSPGRYDYLHLGVLYLETEAYEKAIEAFQRQDQQNPLAEAKFYWAKAVLASGQATDHKALLREAETLYIDGQKMFDPYTHPYDKIFLEDIVEAIYVGGN